MDYLDRIALLAELWWLEYEDAARDALAAMEDGRKGQAICLAIEAHKAKIEYGYYANILFLS
jgi:hypothetical protein